MCRVEDQIASEGELDAVLVVRAEKVVAFGRILGRLCGVRRARIFLTSNPSNEVEHAACSAVGQETRASLR